MPSYPLGPLAKLKSPPQAQAEGVLRMRRPSQTVHPKTYAFQMPPPTKGLKKKWKIYRGIADDERVDNLVKDVQKTIATRKGEIEKGRSHYHTLGVPAWYDPGDSEKIDKYLKPGRVDADEGP